MLVELLHSRTGLAKEGVCRFPAGMQLSDFHPAAPLLLSGEGRQHGVIRKTSEGALGKAWDTGPAVTQEQHREVGAAVFCFSCVSLRAD